ncbi:hypothetical protein C8J57DRAFT_128905 [Mycena rebaudengoi]|nr:hypothetical protein C8J57DRAFT_128905 [Mycena rebaudengoi]
MFAQGETPFSLTPNLINPRVVFEIMSARPGRSLSNARCPLLVVTAQNDDIFPTRIADEIAEMAADKLTRVEAPGGHYDIMEGAEGFDVNISAQINFLRGLL